MSRPWKITLTLVLLLACGIGWFVFQLFGPSPPIVVSKETTYITEPLADDGLPDIARYCLTGAKRGVMPENNGAIPFLQAMWPAALDAPGQRAITQELGMPTPSAHGLGDPAHDREFFQLADRWIVDQEATRGVTTLDNRFELMMMWAELTPWKHQDFVPLAEWIDRHSRQYDLLHLAASKPQFYAPSPTHLLTPKECQLLVLLPIEQNMQAAGDCLSFRCMLQLGEGNHRGAWKDALATHELARRVPRGSLVADIISFNLERKSNRLTRTILAESELPLDLAKEILLAYRQRSERYLVADTVDRFERLLFVSFILSLANERPFDVGGDIEKSTFVDLGHFQLGIDWNVVLRMGNEWYDRLASAMTRATPQARHQAAQQFYHECEALGDDRSEEAFRALWNRWTRSKLAGEICVMSLIPPATAALTAEERCNTDLLLHQVAAALAVYRLEQGIYPDSLDALVPALLPELPVDPYNAPLMYRPTNESFLLYSLGLNGIDEQGSNESLWNYQGFDVERDESAAREHLGLPLLDDSEEEAGPAGARLKDQIPPDADDWSLRLPLPRVAFPLSD